MTETAVRHPGSMNSNGPTGLPSGHTRTGGAYIPPARLRALQSAISDKASAEYQRLAWEALKKSLNGLINKVNTGNIKNIVPELLGENLVKGRGLLCRSLMKAQAASLPFTPVYAALVAIVNTKFPQIGELLLMRLIAQFRRAYKRSDKAVCLAVTKFLGHLVNVRVANEIVALQLLTLLLEKPTDDSVEVAVGFMRDVGSFLSEESSRATNAVFERFRAILHEGVIDKRTQYMVEVLFQVRKDKFKDHPAIPADLDLVEEEDQMTHNIGLTDDLDVQDTLNVFAFDPDFLDNEAKYVEIKKEILGEESDDEEADDEDSSSESDDDFEEEQKEKAKLIIQDQTNTNLVNLRRAIYLTIMSSLNFEECAHKLLKLNIQKGQESELTAMIVECCSQEKTFVSFYGLLGERFCRLSSVWASAFAQGFEETYKTVHRFETSRLRNIAKYYGHLLATGALDWSVFSLVSITEHDTTSSSRIFLKILLTDLVEAMGLKKLAERFADTSMMITVETAAGSMNRGAFDGMFPKDHPKNTRFAINYFTSIGLGALTDGMREYLKNAMALAQARKQAEGRDSSSSSGSSSDSDSSSSSGGDSDSSNSSSGSSSSLSSSRSSRREHSKRRESTPSRREHSKRRGSTSPRREHSKRRGSTPPRREQRVTSHRGDGRNEAALESRRDERPSSYRNRSVSRDRSRREPRSPPPRHARDEPQRAQLLSIDDATSERLNPLEAAHAARLAALSKRSRSPGGDRNRGGNFDERKRGRY